MVMNITYENLSDSIAEEVSEDVRDNWDAWYTVNEKEVDDMINAKVSEACPGDLDHFDVASLVKEKIDCWDAILPYGA
jgi:hypothetical protein